MALAIMAASVISEAGMHYALNLVVESAREDALWTDLVVSVGGQRFNCHRIVIAAHSPFLGAVLREAELQGHDDPVIVVDNADAIDIRAALKFAYCGRVDSGEEESLGRGATALRFERRSDLRCCETRFESELDLVAHSEYTHSTPRGDRYLVCCDQKIFGTFRVHLQTRHSLETDTDRSRCCDGVFDDVGGLTRHLSASHGLRLWQYERTECCSTPLANLAEWLRHKQQDSAHVECAHCAFLSKDAAILDNHLRLSHSVSVARHSDAGFSCDTCGRSFRMKSSLRSHLYRLGKDHDPGLKRFGCDRCPRVFGTVVSRRLHVRRDHQRKAELACGSCDGTFVDQNKLQTHVKSVHEKIRDAQCASCGKLLSKERILAHQRYVHHVAEEEVSCDDCGKTFANQERMSDHRRSVHKKRIFQCEFCGNAFKNGSTLKSHVFSRHVDHSQKPLQCAFCGHGFLHESRLRAHEVTHSGETPFRCAFCGRGNKSKSNNLKHEKICKMRPLNIIEANEGADWQYESMF